MSRRRAAHTQADYERMLRAAISVTGRPHIIEARPDGSCKILPLETQRDSGDTQPMATIKVDLGGEIIL